MNGFRFLLLVMAICLASGVKAQFFDGPDDIYYYVEVCYEYEETVMRPSLIGPQLYKTGKTIKKLPEKNKEDVLIFNFDGKNAAELSGGASTYGVKLKLQESPNYYEEKIETTDYEWEFISSSYSGTIYRYPRSNTTYLFSSNRYNLTATWYSGDCKCQKTYKKVDKSFFKVGRSRTPSDTLHE